MRTLLTIDWDYFLKKLDGVAGLMVDDIGHNETPFFNNPMWLTRGALIEHMQTTGVEKTFWDDIQRVLSIKHGASLYVSDSHSCVFKLARHVDHVALIDAHHDCWANPNDGVVACDNWARTLVEQMGVTLFWLYPTEKHWDDCPLPRDMENVYSACAEHFGLYAPAWMPKVDVIHICRSGCWMPPWLDEQFIEFVKSFGKEWTVLQPDLADPMTARWTNYDVAAAKKIHEQSQQLLEKVGSHA